MELLRQMAAVGLVLALLAGALYWLRRKGLVVSGGRRKTYLEVAERLPLAPHHTLCLVRVADRALVVDVHAQGATLLASFEGAEMVPSAPLVKGAGR